MKLEPVKVGSKNKSTIIVQMLLRTMGYCGADCKPLKIDGDFNTQTLYAVLRFQEQAIAYGANIGGEDGNPDGVWGEKCWRYTLGTLEINDEPN